MDFDAPQLVDSHPTVTDNDAIAEVMRGNREMFEVLVRRHNQRLFRIGMAHLRDHALVEDAMQNTYFNAFLHLGHFQGSSAFATWLTRIMINECLGLIRKQKSAEKNFLSHDLIVHAVARNENHGERTASLKEMKVLLEKAIIQLPAKYRTLYMLREVQQLSTAETAETLQISQANVKVGLHRAREMLKAQLLAGVEGQELFPYPARYCNAFAARIMARILGV